MRTFYQVPQFFFTAISLEMYGIPEARLVSSFKFTIPMAFGMTCDNVGGVIDTSMKWEGMDSSLCNQKFIINNRSPLLNISLLILIECLTLGSIRLIFFASNFPFAFLILWDYLPTTSIGNLMGVRFTLKLIFGYLYEIELHIFNIFNLVW